MKGKEQHEELLESVRMSAGVAHPDINPTPISNPHLIRQGAECRSADIWLGRLSSVHVCAAVVMANGGTFFIYGTGGKPYKPGSNLEGWEAPGKQGFCYQENTKSAQCLEGWETDSYNFYSVNAFKLIKRGAECMSSDQRFGIQSSLHACATVVMANGGTFFIYGTGGKQGWCFQENTKSAQCPEGWETDSYNFYSLPVPIS